MEKEVTSRREKGEGNIKQHEDNRQQELTLNKPSLPLLPPIYRDDNRPTEILKILE